MTDSPTVEAAEALSDSRNGSGGLHSQRHNRPEPVASTSQNGGGSLSPRTDHQTLPPTPHLWPERPMTLEELQGDWQLVASSLPMWRARRNVVAKFHPLDSPSSSSGNGPKFQSSWSYFEIASYQAKTLLQRMAEDRQAKKLAKERQLRETEEETSDEATDRKLEQQGEVKTVVSGTLTKDDRHGCLRYRPDRMTFQKVLGKDIVWEIFGYGYAEEPSTTQRPQEVAWFVAYAHPLPMLHSFVSIYLRPHVLENTDTAMILYEDILDCLNAPQSPGRSSSSSSSSASTNGGERERGRTRTRGETAEETPAIATNGNGTATNGNGAAMNGDGANGRSSTASATKESKTDRRQRKDRAKLRYEIKRLAGQVRLVRGV